MPDSISNTLADAAIETLTPEPAPAHVANLGDILGSALDSAQGEAVAPAAAAPTDGAILVTALDGSTFAISPEQLAALTAVREAAELPIPFVEQPAQALINQPAECPLTIEQLVERGYHMVTAADDSWYLSGLVAEVLGAGHNACYNHWRSNRANANRAYDLSHDCGEPYRSWDRGLYSVPVLFVKKVNGAIATGGRLYEPLTDWDEIRQAVAFLSDQTGQRYFAGTNTRSARHNPETPFNQEIFRPTLGPNERPHNPWPEKAVLWIDGASRDSENAIVSGGWNYTLIVNDENPKIKIASKSKVKTKTASRGNTLVIDTNGLLVLDKHGWEGIKGQVENLSEVLKKSVFKTASERPDNLLFNGLGTMVPFNEYLGLNPKGVEQTIGEENEGIVGTVANTTSGSAMKNVVLTTCTIESIAAYNALIVRALTVNDFAGMYVKKFSTRWKSLADKLDKEIAKASQTIMSAGQRRGELTVMLEMLDRHGIKMITEKLESLAQLPGVESSSFTTSGVEIITREYEHGEGSSYRFIGKFRFVLNLLNNGISIQNLMQEKETGPTCTTQTGYTGVAKADNGFCLGSYPSVLGSAMATGNYEALVLTLIDFASQPHLRDGSAARVYNSYFPRSRPENPVPGYEYKLFDGTSYAHTED